MQLAAVTGRLGNVESRVDDVQSDLRNSNQAIEQLQEGQTAANRGLEGLNTVALEKINRHIPSWGVRAYFQGHNGGK